MVFPFLCSFRVLCVGFCIYPAIIIPCFARFGHRRRKRIFLSPLSPDTTASRPTVEHSHRQGGWLLLGNTAQFPPCGLSTAPAAALPKCSIMSGCATRIVLRGQKPLALCDRCPCFGSLFPPLAALTLQHPVLSALLVGICRTSLAVSALRIARCCLLFVYGFSARWINTRRFCMGVSASGCLET